MCSSYNRLENIFKYFKIIIIDIRHNQKIIVQWGGRDMEVVLEQFIASDRPKRISNMFKNLAIVFGVAAILFIFIINIDIQTMN